MTMMTIMVKICTLTCHIVCCLWHHFSIAKKYVWPVMYCARFHDFDPSFSEQWDDVTCTWLAIWKIIWFRFPSLSFQATLSPVMAYSKRVILWDSKPDRKNHMRVRKTGFKSLMLYTLYNTLGHRVKTEHHRTI